MRNGGKFTLCRQCSAVRQFRPSRQSVPQRFSLRKDGALAVVSPEKFPFGKMAHMRSASVGSEASAGWLNSCHAPLGSVLQDSVCLCVGGGGGGRSGGGGGQQTIHTCGVCNLLLLIKN